MNCDEYLGLSHQEKFILIGQTIHLLQNNSEAFMAISSMVRSSAQQGEFDGLKIFPERDSRNNGSR